MKILNKKSYLDVVKICDLNPNTNFEDSFDDQYQFNFFAKRNVYLIVLFSSVLLDSILLIHWFFEIFQLIYYFVLFTEPSHKNIWTLNLCYLSPLFNR